MSEEDDLIEDDPISVPFNALFDVPDGVLEELLDELPDEEDEDELPDEEDEDELPDEEDEDELPDEPLGKAPEYSLSIIVPFPTNVEYSASQLYWYPLSSKSHLLILLSVTIFEPAESYKLNIKLLEGSNLIGT